MPGADVADRLRGLRAARRASPATTSAARSGAGASSTTFWWRRWIEQSRSPSTSDAAVAVAQHLHLDVPAVLDVRLDEDGRVAEGRRRLGGRLRDLAGQVGERAYDAHAAAAATRGRLDQQGQVGLGGGRAASSSARARRPPPSASWPRPCEPICSIDSGAGPTQVSPASITCAREVGVLGEEPVAGVYGVRAGAPRGLDTRSARR